MSMACMTHGIQDCGQCDLQPWGPATESYDSGHVTPPGFHHVCGGGTAACDCYEQYEDYLADGGWAE